MKNDKNIVKKMQEAARLKAIVDSGEIATEAEATFSTEDNISHPSSEEIVNEYLGEIDIEHKEVPDGDIAETQDLDQELPETDDGVKIAQKAPPETPVHNPYPKAHPQLFG